MSFENIIVIESSHKEDVISSLQAFANIYHQQEFARRIPVYCVEEGSYYLALTGIDLEHFLYAVNYLTYPETKVEFRAVYGYQQPKGPMYFVPKNDTEYDNCYEVTPGGEVFKHVFDGSRNPENVAVTYVEPAFDISSKLLIEEVSAVAPLKKKGLLSWLLG